MAVKSISYAASDIGKHRSSNQDSGYAGYQLYFVADGMGGHAGGDIASAISSQRIALTDARYESVEEAIESLESDLIGFMRLVDANLAILRAPAKMSGAPTPFTAAAPA